MASLGMIAAATPPGTHKQLCQNQSECNACDQMHQAPLPPPAINRLQAQPSTVRSEAETEMNEGEARVDFNSLPVEPAELDDSEFGVAALRKWS